MPEEKPILGVGVERRPYTPITEAQAERVRHIMQRIREEKRRAELLRERVSEQPRLNRPPE